MLRNYSGAVVLIVLAALTAQVAQAGDVTTDLIKRDTKIITITGSIGLQTVWREDFFDSVFPRNDHSAPYSNGLDQDELFINPYVSLKLKAELPECFYGILELKTLPDAYGMEQGYGGTNSNFFHIEQANLGAEEFLGKGFSISLGIMPVKVDLRGNGDCFFANISESENPFTGAIHTWPEKNFIPWEVTGAPSGITGSGYEWNPFLGGNAWWNNYRGQSKYSEFAGFGLCYKGLDDMFSLDVWGGFTMETGLTGVDTFVALAVPKLKFDLSGTEQDKSTVQILLSVLQGDKDTVVASMGFGFDIWFYKDWFEVFFEYVGQFGEYTAEKRTPGHDLTHHVGNAFYGGTRIEPRFDERIDLRPFFEISYWWISGDDGDPNDVNRDYLSFEDVDTMIIMEGKDIGLDVDCNYRALKWEIGLKFENFEFSVRYGMFYLIHAPKKSYYGNPPDGHAHYSKMLGNEVDIRFSFKVQEHVTISAVAGLVFDAEFWDESTESRQVRPLPWQGSGTDAGVGLLEFKLDF